MGLTGVTAEARYGMLSFCWYLHPEVEALSSQGLLRDVEECVK